MLFQATTGFPSVVFRFLADPLWSLGPFDTVAEQYALAFRFLGAVLVGLGARRFLRSFWIWASLALAFSPVAALIFLPAAGLSHRRAERKKKLEILRKRRPGLSEEELKEAVSFESNCPHCGALINFKLGEGLEQEEGKPWVLLCRSCHRKLEISP